MSPYKRLKIDDKKIFSENYKSRAKDAEVKVIAYLNGTGVNKAESDVDVSLFNSSDTLGSPTQRGNKILHSTMQTVGKSKVPIQEFMQGLVNLLGAIQSINNGGLVRSRFVRDSYRKFLSEVAEVFGYGKNSLFQSYSESYAIIVKRVVTFLGVVVNGMRPTTKVYIDTHSSDGFKKAYMLILKKLFQHDDVYHFSMFSFDGMDFKQFIFKNCDFFGAEFYNTNLTDATFENCDLEQTRFDAAKLTNTRFINCKTGITEFDSPLQLIDAYISPFPAFYSSCCFKTKVGAYGEFGISKAMFFRLKEEMDKLSKDECKFIIDGLDKQKDAGKLAIDKMCLITLEDMSLDNSCVIKYTNTNPPLLRFYNQQAIFEHFRRGSETCPQKVELKYLTFLTLDNIMEIVK